MHASRSPALGIACACTLLTPAPDARQLPAAPRHPRPAARQRGRGRRCSSRRRASPRSMMRSSSPVLRCRWKFRSMPSTWEKVSSEARLRGGGCCKGRLGREKLLQAGAGSRGGGGCHNGSSRRPGGSLVLPLPRAAPPCPPPVAVLGDGDPQVAAQVGDEAHRAAARPALQERRSSGRENVTVQCTERRAARRCRRATHGRTALQVEQARHDGESAPGRSKPACRRPPRARKPASTGRGQAACSSIDSTARRRAGGAARAAPLHANIQALEGPAASPHNRGSGAPPPGRRRCGARPAGGA